MNIFLLLFLLVVSVVMMAYGLTHLNPNENSEKSNALTKSNTPVNNSKNPISKNNLPASTCSMTTVIRLKNQR